MTEQEWLLCEQPERMLGILDHRNAKKLPKDSPFWHSKLSERKMRLFACACWREFISSRKDDSFDYPQLRAAVAAAEAWAETGEVPLVPPHVANYVVLSSDAVYAVRQTLSWVSLPNGIAPSLQADLLRNILGNPFRPVTHLPVEFVRVGKVRDVDGRGWVEGIKPVRCPWLSPTVVSLAEAAYQERMEEMCRRCDGCGGSWHGNDDDPWKDPCPDCHGQGRIVITGHLDNDRLLVLADALEDAGCTDESVLNHLRGEICPWCKDAIFDVGDSGMPHIEAKIGRHFHAQCVCKGTRRIQSVHVRGDWVLDLILGKE